MMRARWLLSSGVALVGCLDDATPRRDLELLDVPSSRPDVSSDATVVSDASSPGDAGVDATADAALDASRPSSDAAAVDARAVADAAPEVDAGNGTPEVCNGEDEDADDVVDEGVSNVCGGCGGLPEEGCQAWRVEILQTGEARAQPGRIVGLQGNTLGFSEVEIEGGVCVAQTAPPPHPDAHLGVVNVDSPGVALTLVPRVDAQRGGFAYDPNPEVGGLQVFRPGDALDVRWGGGRLVGLGAASIEGPAALEGVDSVALDEAVARAQGVGEAPVSLTWAAPAASSTRLRLFIGGSAPIFNRNVYRGIRHYTLDASLTDDGEVTLPTALFAGGVVESSVWVYLRRAAQRRLVLGPHSIDVSAAWRVEARGRGVLERDESPPFDIIAPSPDVRAVRFGEAVEVRWTPVPVGTGPLDVQLVAFDAATGTTHVVACRALAPESGILRLPGALTADWPSGAGVEAQLAVQLELARIALATPDQGAMVHGATLLMQLRP